MSATPLHSTLTNPGAIKTNIFHQTPDEKGYLQLERHVSLEEFLAQVKNTLSSIMITEGKDTYSAYDAAESFFVSIDLRTTPDPALFRNASGRLFAIYCHGHCEGRLIRIVLLREDDTYVQLVQLKYFINETAMLSIVRHLADAFREGEFN